MAKKRLNDEVKLFIGKHLAEMETPSEVATLVKVNFGILINRQTAQLYNPETVAGKDLSQPLKDLYFETRRQHIQKQSEEFEKYRVERLKRLYPKLYSS